MKVIAALVFLAASVTYAADFCITESTFPGLTYVGQNFKIPAKGKCKAWIGFVSLGAQAFPSSGTACTFTNGSELVVSLAGVAMSILTMADAAYFQIDLPSMAVSIASDSQLGAGFVTNDVNNVPATTAGPCVPPVHPVP
jgi:hypothetical protein